MKKFILLFLIFLSPLLTQNKEKVDFDLVLSNEYNIDNRYDIIINEEEKININEILPYDIDYYSFWMGYHESRNNYLVVNRFGYMGKYQFGKSTLRLLIDKGFLKATYRDIQENRFIRNIELQESAMKALTYSNYIYLKNNNLTSYIGMRIGGVRITIYGLLAASHLRGSNAVKLFLKTNGRVNMKDGNKTSVRDYIKKFT